MTTLSVIERLSAAVIEGQEICDNNKRDGWHDSFWETTLLPQCRAALAELNQLMRAGTK